MKNELKTLAGDFEKSEKGETVGKVGKDCKSSIPKYISLNKSKKRYLTQ